MINALLLKLASMFTPGFRVHGFLAALLGSLVLTILTSFSALVVFAIVHTPANSRRTGRSPAASARSTTAPSSLEGDGTKRAMAGPVEPADESITTARAAPASCNTSRATSPSASRPACRWCEFTRLLAAEPPDGPARSAVCRAARPWAAWSRPTRSGPRRRLYGTARDLVIGMQFATLEGKLVQSGGMVVKNVAGLDMAKLMIGSFGTLAAIAVVNFKLLPDAGSGAQLPAAVRLAGRGDRGAQS